MSPLLANPPRNPITITFCAGPGASLEAVCAHASRRASLTCKLTSAFPQTELAEVLTARVFAGPPGKVWAPAASGPPVAHATRDTSRLSLTNDLTDGQVPLGNASRGNFYRVQLSMRAVGSGCSHQCKRNEFDLYIEFSSLTPRVIQFQAKLSRFGLAQARLEGILAEMSGAGRVCTSRSTLAISVAHSC